MASDARHEVKWRRKSCNWGEFQRSARADLALILSPTPVSSLSWLTSQSLLIYFSPIKTFLIAWRFASPSPLRQACAEGRTCTWSSGGMNSLAGLSLLLVTLQRIHDDVLPSRCGRIPPRRLQLGACCSRRRSLFGATEGERCASSLHNLTLISLKQSDGSTLSTSTSKDIVARADRWLRQLFLPSPKLSSPASRPSSWTFPSPLPTSCLYGTTRRLIRPNASTPLPSRPTMLSSLMSARTSPI